MPHRRRWRSTASAALLLGALAIAAAACAPGPELGETSQPPPAPTTEAPTPTTPAPPSTEPPASGIPQIAPPDLFPVSPDELLEVDPVRGRVAVTGADAAIRTGSRTIDLDTGALPAQPTWARDGSRLAIVSRVGRQPTVTVVDGLTGDVIADPDAERLYFFLSWSHDGTRIAALGPGVDANDQPQTVLDILDADGTPLHTDVTAASSLYLAWEPEGLRLAAHADDRLLRIDADGTAADLGQVGTEFFAPKWIPGTGEIVLVTDIESSARIVRRTVDGADTLRSLGEAGPRLGISVNPRGDVAAISQETEVEGGGAAERIGLPFLPQTGGVRSGTVELLDLETGTRTQIFTGLNLWVEWNPQGTRLLIYEADIASGTGTWWVYDHDVGTEGEPAETPDDEAQSPTQIVTFSPTPIFLGSYLSFADQFIESPRLWSPTGQEFVYAELTDAGSLIRTIGAGGGDEPDTIGAGEVGFWSPAP